MTGWAAIPVTVAEDEAWDAITKLTPGAPTSGRVDTGGVPDAHSAAPSSGHPIHGAQGTVAGLDRRPALPNLASSMTGAQGRDESAGHLSPRVRAGNAPDQRARLETARRPGSAPSRTSLPALFPAPIAHPSAAERCASLPTGASAYPSSPGRPPSFDPPAVA